MEFYFVSAKQKISQSVTFFTQKVLFWQNNQKLFLSLQPKCNTNPQQMPIFLSLKNIIFAYIFNIQNLDAAPILLESNIFIDNPYYNEYALAVSALDYGKGFLCSDKKE